MEFSTLLIFSRYNQSLGDTLSVEIASFPQQADSAEMLITQEDNPLYQAKQGGHNQVCYSNIDVVVVGDEREGPVHGTG